MEGSFVQLHRALILKHARAHVRAAAEKIATEDVAHELELVAARLEEANDVGGRLASASSPDAMLRAIVRHAAGRAKRRRTLVDQVAAGDDLEAVRAELASLDANLPAIPEHLLSRDDEARHARATLDAVRAELAPIDRLVLSMWIEDVETDATIAEALGRAPADVAASRARALAAAAATGVSAEIVDASERPSSPPEQRREKRLFALAQVAGAPSADLGHVEEPVLALVRSGDAGDDLADALSHLAACADCRARLTEGDTSRRSLVVMAIEAPRASLPEIASVVEGAGARLVDRGPGRWTAVVDADRASALRGKLEGEAPEGSAAKVVRLAVAQPVDVPLDAGEGPGSRGARTSRSSRHELLPETTGTAAAEVAAWAAIARAPRREVPAPSVGWTTFAVGAVAVAVAIGYFLATR